MDDGQNLQDLTREQLIEMLQEKAEGGVKIQFAGKANARRIARLVRPRVQRSLPEYSVGEPEAQAHNLVIEGDNLQAMVTLYRERGQVDLILTDPPYNTGNDFRYNDRWDEDPNDPGLGDLIKEDDEAKHTKWMRFMYPRLKMMKSMLKPNGVLAICIDYRELFHLGQMLDELFGAHNRLAIINWQRTYTQSNDKGHVATTTEYVLVYSKSAEKAETRPLPRSETTNAAYGSPDGNPRPWDDGPATGSNAAAHMSMVYAIQNPFTGEVQYPPSGSAWRHEQAQILRWVGEWNVDFELRDIGDLEKRAEHIGVAVKDLPAKVRKVKAIMVKGDLAEAAKNAQAVYDTGPWPEWIWLSKGKGRPRVKRYLENVRQGIVPTTFWLEDYEHPHFVGAVSWPHQQSGHSEQGVAELTAIVGTKHGFKTVKPMKLMQKIIQIWSPPDGLVVDPFAGSGTTAHAVLALNSDAGAKRRFILIEQGRPERGDSYARSLTADRLSRVVSGEWHNGKGVPLPGGYRFVTLDKKVDADALLAMEREEMVDTVIASYYDTNRRRGPGLITVSATDYRYLVARNADDEGFFLIWEGPDKNTDLTEDVYEACSEEASRAGLKPMYHVYARYNLFQTENVRFYQIPDRILIDFGLDLRKDPYSEDDDE